MGQNSFHRLTVRLPGAYRYIRRSHESLPGPPAIWGNARPCDAVGGIADVVWADGIGRKWHVSTNGGAKPHVGN